MEATPEEGGDWSARTHPPLKIKIKPEGENHLDHGPKSPPWRTTVLNLKFKPRPVVIGALTSFVRHFVVFLHEGPFFLNYRPLLRCEGHPEFNLYSAVSSCVTISSCVAIPHYVGMSLYGASLLVLVALRQGTVSQTETHMHGEKVRH